MKCLPEEVMLNDNVDLIDILIIITKQTENFNIEKINYLYLI